VDRPSPPFKTDKGQTTAPYVAAGAAWGNASLPTLPSADDLFIQAADGNGDAKLADEEYAEVVVGPDA
jgi:hypothetical protein